MCEHLLKSQHIAGKRRGTVIDHRFPKCWPRIAPREYVHSRSAAEHLPPGSLEEAEKRRLIEVTERIAFIGVDNEVDLWSGHAVTYGKDGRDGKTEKQGRMFQG
jgi:hypothetical protein